MPDTPRHHARPSPRPLFVIAVAVAVVSFILTLSYGFADHAPAPHGVRIAVAAPAGLTHELTAGLAHAAPGGFTVLAEPSASAVTSSVLSQSAAGGLVASATGPLTIVTAAAAGASQQQAVNAALTAAATALHRQARPLDVAPLPAGDRAGESAFVFELGLLIPSVIGSIGLFLVGRRFRLWWRVTAAVVFALLAACGSVLALDTVLGALTGASAALLGIAFLGSLTYVAFITACQAVTGLPGTALGALAFIFVGNAVSGGTVPFAFLPGGFRQVAPWLPNGAIVSAARDVVYLPASNLGHPLLVLGIWLAGSLAVLAGVDLLHLAERRRTPDQEAQIYATPGTAHLRHRLARSRAAALTPAADLSQRHGAQVADVAVLLTVGVGLAVVGVGVGVGVEVVAVAVGDVVVRVGVVVAVRVGDAVVAVGVGDAVVGLGLADGLAVWLVAADVACGDAVAVAAALQDTV
jgi:hypothetical protein